jgi:glycosyltransferase involved in cell wall biosynthesis
LNCGIVEEFSKKGVIRAVKKLRDNPKLCKQLGRNGLKAAIDKYNWAEQEKILIKVYKRLMK